MLEMTPTHALPVSGMCLECRRRYWLDEDPLGSGRRLLYRQMSKGGLGLAAPAQWAEAWVKRAKEPCLASVALFPSMPRGLGWIPALSGPSTCAFVQCIHYTIKCHSPGA